MTSVDTTAIRRLYQSARVSGSYPALCHAAAQVPALLAEVERLTAELDATRIEVTGLVDLLPELTTTPVGEPVHDVDESDWEQRDAMRWTPETERKAGTS